MNFDLILAYFGTFSAILFLFLSILIVIFFLGPLQFRFSLVRNGLAKLRILFLFYGFGVVVTNIIALVLLSWSASRIIESGQTGNVNPIGQFLLFVFGASELFKAIVAYVMYHLQFTPEQVLIHDRMEKAEKRRDRKIAKEENESTS